MISQRGDFCLLILRPKFYKLLDFDGKVKYSLKKDYSIATTLDSIRHIVDEKGLIIDEVIDYLDRMPDTILEYDTVFLITIPIHIRISCPAYYLRSLSATERL